MTPQDHDDPAPLRRGLDRVLRSLGAPSSQAAVDVVARWPEIVGEDLAEVTRPGRFRNGILTVLAEDPAVAEHLRWSESTMLERAERVFGADVVRHIVIRVRPDGR